MQESAVRDNSVPLSLQLVANFSHLDGCSTFGKMQSEKVPGVSHLALHYPDIFEALLLRLKEYAPDAFDIKPPAAKSGEVRQLMVSGRCQSGKTGVTLALAWLYYHYCGCCSFLYAWRYVSSVTGEISGSCIAIDTLLHSSLLKRNP